MRFAPLAMGFALVLAACGPKPQPTAPQPAPVPVEYQARVDNGPNGEPIKVAAVRADYLNERNTRRMVSYNGNEKPGTIVVDPYARFLYHITAPGQAMRYGVAVGKQGKTFSGDGVIKRKAEWPSWRPTQNMIRTQPEIYEPVKDGKPGGLDNPLGSRALYLYKGNRDTMYRIHGTMEPSSIGKATSAGCIRMFQQDVMDLYEQIPTGTRVHVRTLSESKKLEGPTIEQANGYLLPISMMAEATGQPAR